MKVKFGPAGIGAVKDVNERFSEFARLGIKSATIPFTYGVYIKNKDDALIVRKAAKKYGIELDIHAPYWINLNSKDKEKIEASKQRIIKCLEVGTWVDAKLIVFHAGYYGGMDKEEAYNNIKDEILELQKIRKEKSFTPELCPEVMGKVNVFGSPEEISMLAKDTKCKFCLDFAHILAREKELNMKKLEKLFPQKEWHCHFSGIEYTEKGEKRHKKTEEKYWIWLLKKLPKDKNISIINESPNSVEDSVLGLKVYTQKI